MGTLHFSGVLPTSAYDFSIQPVMVIEDTCEGLMGTSTFPFAQMSSHNL